MLYVNFVYFQSLHSSTSSSTAAAVASTSRSGIIWQVAGTARVAGTQLKDVRSHHRRSWNSSTQRLVDSMTRRLNDSTTGRLIHPPTRRQFW